MSLPPQKGCYDTWRGLLSAGGKGICSSNRSGKSTVCGASPEELQGLRQKYHAENCPLFLTVSRMAKEKNVEFLLRGLAALKQREAQPFQVLFVGEGPDREALEALRNELGLKDVCHFTGQVENERIPLYYQAADAFLFASKTETQGIVLLEAFAGKTPVIALRASGVEDIVTDGKTGLLTEENPDSFAGQSDDSCQI